MVFGYGYETWDWQAQIRSWLPILPFSFAYYLVKIVGLDMNSSVVIAAPRIVQAVFGACFDLATFKLAKKLFGQSSAAKYTLFLSLISMFNLTYLCRTLINSMEASMTAVILYLWPIHAGSKPIPKKRFALSITLLAFLCACRPSAALNWIFPAAYLICHISIDEQIFVISSTIIAAAVSVLTCTFIDTYFYESSGPVLAWWNFAMVNLGKGAALHFGRSPGHFYLTQGLPLLSFTGLPLLIIGIIMAGRGWAVGFICSAITLHSFVAHKEFRFIYGVMPVILTTSGFGLHVLVRMWKDQTAKRRFFLAFLILSNLGAGYYFTRWHQSGALPAIDWIRDEIDSGNVTSVSFLMPCHSTPFYSYLHRNVPMKFLSCSPPVDPFTHQCIYEPGFQDESDQFYLEPGATLSQNPQFLDVSHILLFESLLEDSSVKGKLEESGFKESRRFFNTHWHDDKRRRGDIIALTRL